MVLFPTPETPIINIIFAPIHHSQHIHFKCNRCEIIFCVEVDKIPAIRLPKYKIEKLEIQATGLCQDCNI